ncbi:uncharacterized protein LOC125008569 [Mugil cephalus]|uniref:uncharacterized protein LOC125008569 n=1 Tax=Mugil cephalus TaxID=48193 RepID=UPI001FB63A15|nr:uncharacterized protein LOC125008569 [Mugil cephalus]
MFRLRPGYIHFQTGQRHRCHYSADMLLAFLTVSCVFFGSSVGEEVCYGHKFKLPLEYSPPLYNGPLYFIPSNGGPRKLVMDDGEVKDPRFTLSTYSFHLNDVMERDDGYFSTSFNGENMIAKLKYLDCAESISRKYGHEWSKRIPSYASFLEYTNLNSSDHPKILWNRTDPEVIVGQKGRVIINAFEILHLTQEDNGYYNFRKRDNTLLYRGRLVVEGETIHYDPEWDSRLMIDYPRTDRKWTVTFTPKGEMKPQTVMKAGDLVSSERWFSYRIQAIYHGIEINPVDSTDSGTFEFRDPQGNLALTAIVEVYQELSDAMQYLVLFAMMILGWILCCCWYSCKRSCKKDKSAPQAAEAPAVHGHGDHKPAASTQLTSLISLRPRCTLQLPPMSQQLHHQQGRYLLHVHQSAQAFSPQTLSRGLRRKDWPFPLLLLST